MLSHFTLLLLVVYMSINVYSDIRYLKTWNWLHYSLFLLSIPLFVWFKLSFIYWFLILLITGCIGWVLRKIHRVFGAGDIKMLIILSLYTKILFLNMHLYFLILFIQGFYQIVSSLILFSLIVLRKVLKKKQLIFGTYLISKDTIQTPEAVPISLVLGGLIYIYI